MKRYPIIMLLIFTLLLSACAGNTIKTATPYIVDVASAEPEKSGVRYEAQELEAVDPMWFSSGSFAAIDKTAFLLGNYKSTYYLLSVETVSPTVKVIASVSAEAEQWYSCCAFKEKVYVLDTMNSCLIEFTVDGERLRNIPLPQDVRISVLTAGRDYIFGVDNGKLLALSLGADDISVSFEIRTANNPSIANNSDGIVYAAWKENDTQAIAVVDENSKTLENTRYLSADCTLVGTKGNNGVYLRIGSALYSYIFSADLISEVLTFSQVGLIGDGYVFELSANALLYTGTNGTSACAPFVLKPVAYTDEVVELVLATLGELPYSMEKAVVAWNQQHPECYIKVVDYSVYNSASDERAGEMRLVADIGSGSCPDIFNLSGSGNILNAELLYRRGLIED